MSVKSVDIKSTNLTDVNSKIHGWFEKHIQTLKVHELTLTAGIASKETGELFGVLMSEDETAINSLSRAQSSIYFLKNIIQDYINELNTTNCKPLNLALDISDAKVLVWAEVEEYDDINHDNLLLSEAKVNAKYYNFGFHISSTIVEKQDKLNTPNHYQKFSVSNL